MMDTLNMPDEKFTVQRIGKWRDNIECTLTEWATDEVEVWFEVDDPNDLTVTQLQEIEEFIAEAEGTWYDWVLIGFKNIVNEWEHEHNDD